MTFAEPASRRARRGWLLVSVALAGVIAVATLMPQSQMQVGPVGMDKLYHLLAFAALVFPTALLRPDCLTLVLVLAIGYGGLIELVQPLVGRSTEWADLLADAMGAAVGAGLGLGLRRLRSR